jgi:hypothetical protein
MTEHDIEGRSFDDFLDKQFLGVIEDVADPRKEGRAKVRIVGVYDDIPTEDLPWAYPKQKALIFGKAGKSGAVSIPKVGAIVAVKFDNGNPYSPEYFAIHELADDVKSEIGQDGEYEGAHVIVFDGDKELKVWFSPTKGFTIQVKAASINISNDNVVTVKTDNKMNESTAKVVIDSPNIELGKDAAEALIKGNQFMTLFNSHTHASAGATPLPLMTPDYLSQWSKTK